MTLFKTLFSLKERILDKILYIHPRREIALNSLGCSGFASFGIKVIKEELVPFDQLPSPTKLCTALKTSPFIMSQQN